MKRTLASLMLVLTTGLVVTAQEQRVIELRSAQRLEGRVENGENVRELIGDVHFVQRTAEGGMVFVWCDRGLQYLDRNRIDLSGRVRIVRDSMVITAPDGTYDGNTRQMQARNGVRLIRGRMVLTARRGDYWADTRIARFVGQVVLVDSTTTVRCEDLTYFEDEGRSVAVKDVHVYESVNATDVYGDSLIHIDSTGYSVVMGRARLVRIDTSGSGIIDTMVVASRLLHSYRETTQRFVAEDLVRVVRADLSARCGRAFLEGGQERVRLESSPIVWSAENQITGDSMTIHLEQRRLRSLYVKGKAMAVSQADSVRTNRFHQLTGREMTLYFAEKALERVVVERNATSLYYIYDDEAPNGVNRSSGDRIVIDLADGATERIHIAGGVQGTYIPERLIVGQEAEQNLDGFFWRTDRPLRYGLSIIDPIPAMPGVPQATTPSDERKAP